MRRFGLVAIFAGFSLAASAEESGWATYANERFGTTADYPALFSRRERPPENGDGQAFRTADERALLRVYGSYNALNETPRQMMQSRRQSGIAYGYQEATSRWFVLSGTRGDRISYVRCALSDKASDVVGCVEIEYPASEAGDWNPRVARISRSLRFGTSW